MTRSLIFLAILTAGFAAAPVGGTETVCSRPQREGIRARAETQMLAGGEAELVRDLNAFATQAGLSVSGVEVEPSLEEPWRVNIVLLQSPRVTVLLRIVIDTRRRAVALQVQRTCINDAPLEAWRPYWSGLVAYLRARHYVVRPRS